MDHKRMQEIALEQEFVQVEIIPTSRMKFNHQFRMLCESNECGNYNANYGCPPYCGTPEEMEKKARSYRYGLVMQSAEYMEDFMDAAATRQMKKGHNQKTRRAVAQILKESGEKLGALMMPGPCALCAECKMKSGEPCVNPEHRSSCLSAYCVDVQALADACQMELSWFGDPVSCFSVYLFDEVDV